MKNDCNIILLYSKHYFLHLNRERLNSFIISFFNIFATFNLFVDTPDKLTILPEPLLNSDDKLAVKEGESIGPYTCTADCNPPCDMTWNAFSTSGFFAAASTGLLDSHIVNRSIALYRCIAQYPPDKEFKEYESIILDVLCK